MDEYTYIGLDLTIKIPTVDISELDSILAKIKEAIENSKEGITITVDNVEIV